VFDATRKASSMSSGRSSSAQAICLTSSMTVSPVSMRTSSPTAPASTVF